VFVSVLFLAVATMIGQAHASGDPLEGVRPISETRTATAVLPAESSLIGIIDAFEQTARRLVLRTKDARVTFVLAADAVVRRGSRTLPAAELAAQKGRRAKVRFTQNNGSRTAHWIVISTERD